MLYSLYSVFVQLNATNSADECNFWDVPDRMDQTPEPFNTSNSSVSKKEKSAATKMIKICGIL